MLDWMKGRRLRGRRRHRGHGERLDCAKRIEQADRLLREALSPLPLPASVWEGIEARLAGGGFRPEAEAADSRRPAYRTPDPAPALAAAASFCIFLGIYLRVGAGPSWEWVQGLLNQAIVLIMGWWVRLAGTLLMGGS